MRSRSLLSQVTSTFLAALGLVALLALADFAAFQFAAATHREHLELINVSSRQIRLGEQSALLAVLLTEPGNATTRAAVRLQLHATNVELAANQQQLAAAQVELPGWVALLTSLAADYPTKPPEVEALLLPFLVHSANLLALPDAQLSTTQADRIALLNAHEPLVTRLEEAEQWYEELSRIDNTVLIRLQMLTLCLVLGLLVAETIFIFRPLFRRLAAEQRELALLSLVASQTDNGVVITDAQGLVIWANAGFTRLSGYTFADLAGRKPGAILQGADTDPATITAVHKALTAGDSITTELVNYHKDGHPYWISMAITPIYDAQGQLECVIAVDNDITARKDLETWLRASLKDLADMRFALDQAAIVAITDPAGVIIEVNDLFCRISGYTQAELIGQTHRLLNSGYHDAAFWRELWETIRQGKVWRGEIRNRTKHGQFYWVAATIVPFLDPTGKPISYIAVRFDISERKRAALSLHERTVRLQIHADITASVGNATEEQAIIAGVVGELAHHVPAFRVAYATLSETAQLTVLRSCEPKGMPALTGQRTDLTPVPTLVAALRAGESIDSPVVETDPRFAPLRVALRAKGTVAMLMVPVEQHGGPVGILSFETAQPHLWSEHELVLLREVADHFKLLLHEAYIHRERERAEQALRASEERLRFQKTLLECQGEASPDGLLVISPDGRLLSINRRFAQLWGLSEALLIQGGRADRMALVAAAVDDGVAFSARLNELSANPAMVATDEIHLRDGRTFELYSAPVRGADGEQFGRFWSYRDITARVVAQAALRASEATNRALLDALPDLMFRMRADGLFISYRASRVTNNLALPPEQFLGRRITEVMPAALAHTVLTAVQTTLETNMLQLVEYKLPSSEGMRDYEARMTPIRGDEVLVIVRDISERKASERLKNEFVAMVSHELRTPLTAIRGSLGLIAGGVAGELSVQARTMIDIAYKNSERLVRLINDILDIEKIESGKMSFHRQPLELGPLLAQTLEATAAYGSQFGITFVLEPSPPMQVFADADRMIQVFTNLLSNAAKFSPAGEAVTVAVQQHAGLVRIGVSDRGPGIPEAFRERIFQQFAQADSSSTRAKGGTGLGLSIVRAIVERHGGRVSFESTMEVGTTFFVDLPEWHPIEHGTADTANGRVLVCEDDPDIAHLLTLMLQRAGFTVDVTYTADAMRARLVEGDYDVLTLDIRLQHEDGVQLIRELRAHAATVNLPIIVVSGQVERARMELGSEEVGQIDWLPKPINPALLVAAVTHAVRHTGSTQPRILHIDDDPDIVQVVAGLLGAGVTVVHAESVAAARAHLAEAHYDLALLDLVLPDGSGLEVLPLLRAQHPPTPVVIFSVHELDPALTGQVAATLVKSRVTNQELSDTIMRLLALSG